MNNTLILRSAINLRKSNSDLIRVCSVTSIIFVFFSQSVSYYSKVIFAGMNDLYYG